MPKTRSATEKSNIRNALRKNISQVQSTSSASPKRKKLLAKKNSPVKTPVKSTLKKRKTVVATTSPRKTRGVYKKEEDMECESCGTLEPLPLLQNCPNCMSLFHLSCMGLEKSAILFIQENPKKWNCPRCICCAKCEEYIYDSSNLQCSYCARAFHGFCRPTKSSLPVYPYSVWCCDKCEQEGLANNNSLPHSSTVIKKSSRNLPRFKEHLLKSKINQKFLSRNKYEIKVEENLFVSTQLNNNNDESTRERLIGGNSLNSLINLTPHRPLSKLMKKNFNRNRCFSKPEILDDNKINNNSDFALAGKMALQKINVLNQWVYFGQFVRFKPIYESSYSNDIASSPNVYVCEFCFRALPDLCQFRNHLSFCPWKHPPGNEIYRDDKVNVWEVEGDLHTTYCRNLCLLAKFFLSSKTLYHEVETFKFYILTEQTFRGCILAGYFSKEKNPSKNNNLSCLLTLPSHQSKSYGKMLIDLSYHLSMREHKIGSPEHPLSDMGLIAYRSYWKSAIVSALRKRRNRHSVFIKDLSIETAIHSCDIISTLLSLGMITFRNDYFYIDTNIAFNASLNSFRRRTIDSNLLLWEPCFDVVPGNKMNSYATD